MDVEKFYNKHAKGYSTGELPTTKCDNARTALSFADDITWNFILKYAPRNKTAKILDAGAGDGYWAQKLIETGYTNVVLLDLSQGMLDEAKKRLSKLKETYNAQYVKSDIGDMKGIESCTFDYIFSQYDPVSLCKNPKEAIKELARVAKKGTHVVVCLDTKFRRVPEMIELRELKALKNLLKTNITNEFGHPQYNFDWEELADYFEKGGLEVITVVGAPVFVHQVNERVLKKLEGDSRMRKELLDIELEYCTNRSLVNFAGHLQMIGKKK
ncbi:MAG: class I SAM-dependent methyltransferase [Candidatus Hodarchaeales archaeon]|jgi:ubiquinone/menaquinone biosynthesis C-methylase UbiE